MPMYEKLVPTLGNKVGFRPAGGAGSRGTLSITLATNLQSVSIDFSRTSQYMRLAPRDILLAASKEAQALAVKYSSGPGKPAGYYRAGTPRKTTDYIINVKSGLLRSSWKRRTVKHTGNKMTVGIYNTARSKRGFNYPLALFTGTVKMRDRPLPQKINDDIARWIDLPLQAHRMRVLRAFRGER